MLLMAGAMQGIWAQQNPYDYLERSWDEEKKEVKTEVKTCTSYTPINGNDEDGWLGLYSGWYVVTGNSSYKVLNVLGDDVHLIIPDGVTLTATGGVKLEANTGVKRKLSIYSQGADNGKLIAIQDEYSGAAGIGSGGGTNDPSAGILDIHGGTIHAVGKGGGAGIGGGEEHGFYPNSNFGGLTIYGGYVTAIGSGGGAGIGSGSECEMVAGYITIYGGAVNATGSYSSTSYTDSGAGIGGGYKSPGAFLDIWGGGVVAVASPFSAAIGSGCEGNGQTTRIHGGTVDAKAYKGAAIGSGAGEVSAGEILIEGGTVIAYTRNYADYDADGAGIGCGQDGTRAVITITGGNVTAISGKYGAGIGGGWSSELELTLNISGGTVNATGYVGIGTGKRDAGSSVYDIKGTINITGGSVYAQGKGNLAFGGTNAPEHMTIYDGATVRYADSPNAATTQSNAGARLQTCANNHYVAIEPCTHNGATCTDNGDGTHTRHCEYCYTVFQPEPHTLDATGACVCGYKIGSIVLADQEDNTSVIAANAGSPVIVTLSGRTLYKNGVWNTLCLPFALNSLTGTPLEGAIVKTLVSASLDDNGVLTLNFSDDLTQLEAGKPYIVKWESAEDAADLVNPVFNAVTLNAAFADVTTDLMTFKGFFSPCSFEGEDKTVLFMGENNTLHYPNAAMTIGSCRAYFKLIGLVVGGSAAGVKSVRLNFSDDEATAIQLIPSADGRWNSSDGRWYSIDGRVLNARPALPGLYIHDGRKVMVK